MMAKVSPLYDTRAEFQGFKIKSSVNTTKNGFSCARGSPRKTFGEQTFELNTRTVKVYKANWM